MYTGIKYQQEYITLCIYSWYQLHYNTRVNTELVDVGGKKSIGEKKGDNNEKYVEKKLHIKIKNKWENK
jgi:hypothetical protein